MPTQHTTRPIFPTRLPLLRINRIFRMGGIEVRNVTALRSQAARIASDHAPLTIDICVPPRPEKNG